MTANNFNAALAATLQWEGGWSDHPRDPGGPTQFGITLARYRAWKRDQSITPGQLRQIGDDEVKAIYKAGYWDTVRGDDLPAGLDLAVFDFAVNSGPARAVKTLQRILGVREDGIMGMMTLNAVRGRSPGELVVALSDARLAFVRSLGTFGAFGKGWTRRIEGVRAKAKAMSQGKVPVVTTDAAKPAAEKARASDTKATAKPGVKPAAAATAGAVATAATAAAQQLQGLSDGLEWLKWAVVGLTIVACAAGLYVALRGGDDA